MKEGITLNMDNLLRKRIEKILRSDEFEVLLKLYNEMIEKWDEQNVIGNNQFETMKLLFLREGKKQGLKEFFDFIENPE